MGWSYFRLSRSNLYRLGAAHHCSGGLDWSVKAACLRSCHGDGPINHLGFRYWALRHLYSPLSLHQGLILKRPWSLQRRRRQQEREEGSDGQRWTEWHLWLKWTWVWSSSGIGDGQEVKACSHEDTRVIAVTAVLELSWAWFFSWDIF